MFPLLKTTRFRIALWNTCGVAAIALAALLAVRQGVSWTMLQETDNNLAEDAREIELALHELPAADFGQLTDELSRKARGHNEHEWFVMLLDDQGNTVWQSNGSDSDTRAMVSPRGPMYTTLANERLLRQPVAANEHRVAKVIIGGSISHIQEIMGRIDRMVATSGLAILLLSPVFGYLLAGRATKYVQEMSATAELLKPIALGERLPLRGTGDEFDRLARTINSLLDRIALFFSQERNFLADAAHELRTPLAAIHSSIEVALAKPRSPDEYRRLLEDVMEEGESLEVLVNQLLLMSEAAARPHVGDTVEVNLSEVVAKSIDMFSGVAEVNDVTLRAEIVPGLFVWGNKAHLRQLLNNLLDNAIKYSPRDAEVFVKLALNSAAQVIVLQVSDTGPGVPAANIPQLFDRFFRVDRSRSRDGKKGTGLGLSICKTIAEAHGGVIMCASTEGHGTTMTVQLPLEQSVEPNPM